MKSRIKISGSNGSNFTLPIHAHLHDTLFNIINSCRPKIQMMNDALMAEWRQCIDLEIDLSREVRKCLETAKMHEKDRERNYYAKYIISRIRQESASPEETYRWAGRRLWIVVEPQKQIYKASVMEKYIRIRMLIENLLDDEENKKCVDLLDLNRLITKMEEANEAYNKLYDERLETRVAMKKQRSRTVRREADRCYNMICKIIELNYYLNNIGADKEEMKKLISSMNGQIQLEKTTFKQIQSHKKDKDADVPAPENEPAENVQTSHRGVSNTAITNTAQMKSPDPNNKSENDPIPNPAETESPGLSPSSP